MRRLLRVKSIAVFTVTGLLLILVNTGCTTSGATTPTIEKLNTPTLLPATPTSTFTYTPTPTLTVTPTFTSIPSTSTPTLTPTQTLTPTLTPVPDQLGETPSDFAADDFSVVTGQFQLQVTEVQSVKDVNKGQYKPQSGNQYFILHGYIYNYSTQDQVFNDVDFRADFNKAENIIPDTGLMYAVQQTLYPHADYPDRNVIGFRDFIVPAKRATEIILAYEAPVTTDYVKLNFTPLGIEPHGSLGFLLFQGKGTDHFVLLKESQNGIPQFTVNFTPDPKGGEVSELIDSQPVTIDNCFNDEPRNREVSYEWSRTAEVRIDEEQSGSYFFSPTLVGILQLTVARHYEKTDVTELSISYTDTLSAAGRKKTNWEVQAYKVSLSGTMTVIFGSQTIQVPYSIGDRLRVDVVSKPADPCPDFTATP